MEIGNIVQLAVQGKFEQSLIELSKQHPRKANEFVILFQNEQKDFVDDFLMLLSDDQRKEWDWLASSEREQKYFLSIPDDQLIKQDWFDFRSCDF